MTFKKSILAAAIVGTMAGTAAHAGEVEVLHWWTSGGEAESIAVLKSMVEDSGHTWKDFAVAGGGGDHAVVEAESAKGGPGSAIGDGNRHNHDELPILVAGKGAGTLKTGQHLRFAKDTPLANLHLSLLERMGVALPSFGDSTGKLENIGS